MFDTACHDHWVWWFGNITCVHWTQRCEWLTTSPQIIYLVDLFTSVDFYPVAARTLACKRNAHCVHGHLEATPLAHTMTALRSPWGWCFQTCVRGTSSLDLFSQFVSLFFVCFLIAFCKFPVCFFIHVNKRVRNSSLNPRG